jgi:hypothetical protein
MTLAPQARPAPLPPGWVRVDCHVHTVTSGDAVLRVEQLTCRAVGQARIVGELRPHAPRFGGPPRRTNGTLGR